MSVGYKNLYGVWTKYAKPPFLEDKANKLKKPETPCFLRVGRNLELKKAHDSGI